MAKKGNKKDGTPIEFYIPTASLGGKGPRVPVPINQPNWKYKTNFNHSELVIAGFFMLMAIALGILLIVSRLYASPLWLVVIMLGIIAIIAFRSAKTLEFQNTENETHSKRKDKKRSERRKDYK